MMTNTQKDIAFIALAKAQIEERLGWGSSKDWSSNNFELLSEQVFEQTGTQLSATTLKRIWGRVRYTATPSDTTLDTLAQYLGYEHWQLFKQQQQRSEPLKVVATPPVVRKKNKRKSKALIIAVTILILLVISAFLIHRKPKLLTEEQLAAIPFEVKKVAEGLPNTVVFSYDVSHLPSSHVQIQQKWDASKRIDIDQYQKEATTTYYYPGYFRSKLVVNDQIVKEHDLYIASDGWLAAIEEEPVPHYILEDELKKDGILRVHEALLEKANAEEIKTLSYFYLKDFDISTTNFTAETAFRNSWRSGNSICQYMKIVITGTNGCLSIPFSIPGCVGELGLYLNDTYVDGKTNDLSAFGCDFSGFQKLKVKLENGEIAIWINDEFIEKGKINTDFGKVAGIKYSFQGAGEVDYVRFWNADDEVIFEEEFNTSSDE